jgi:hypothetical protein
MSSRSPDIEREVWRLFPEKINGWKVWEDRIYDPDTIFKYLNGSGEVYRAYNFERLYARHYVKAEESKIIADLFDMGMDKNAFGIFSHENEGNEVDIGQGSNYMSGLLSFWKDRFFISLFSDAETEEVREALFKLAHKLDSAIGKKGQIPEIISCLPLGGLDKARIRYFHNHIILNHHFFLADENILNLDQQTDCALGFYREGKAEYCLLLIRYPGPGLAASALQGFTSAYMPDASEPGFVQIEDGKWTAIHQENNLLIIIFGAPSRQHALKIIKGSRLNI